MTTSTSDYLSTIEDALRLTDQLSLEQVASLLFDAYVNGRTVFTMGNGASAALASHMACDYGKGSAVDLGRGPDAPASRRLRILSLTDNPALVTAYSNDIDYVDIFVEQLKNLLLPGDLVIGVSGSGSSPNVLRAMTFARAAGATTIGLTGQMASAGKMLALADCCIQAPATLMEQIEDLHVIYHHVISLSLRERIGAHARESNQQPAAGIVSLHESMRYADELIARQGD